MTTSRFSVLVAMTAAIACPIGLTVTGQVRSATFTLKGVWQVTQWTTSGPKGRTNKSPQPWYCIFTDRHYTIIGVNGDTPRPALPAPAKRTTRQLGDAFDRFVAGFGTYETTGREALVITGSGTSSGERTITAKRLVNVNPNDMGGSQTFTYTLESPNTLWLTLTNEGGVPATTFKLTRIE